MLRTLETRTVRLLRPERPGVQTAAKALSIGARGGLSWFVTSFALGRRRSWRAAAVGGVVGWASGSAVAFIVKAVVDRRRPSLPQLGPESRSSSMPSSHTAGAVGYATAVSLADPRLAAGVVPLSVAVGWARAATAQHFPTDVLVGAAIGVAAGTAVHRLGDRPLRGALAPTAAARSARF